MLGHLAMGANPLYGFRSPVKTRSVPIFPPTRWPVIQSSALVAFFQPVRISFPGVFGRALYKLGGACLRYPPTHQGRYNNSYRRLLKSRLRVDRTCRAARRQRVFTRSGPLADISGLSFKALSPSWFWSFGGYQLSTMKAKSGNWPLEASVIE